MITVDGLNTGLPVAICCGGPQQRVRKVTINGYYVTAQIDGLIADVRTPNVKWLDEDHRRLADAIIKLEYALAILLEQTLDRRDGIVK